MAKNNSVPDRIQAVWNILGGDEGIDDILAGKVGVSLTPIAQAVKKVLEDPKPVPFTIGTGINLSEVLKSQEGLVWIDPDLKQILDLATGEAPTSTQMMIRHLKENASDRVIKAELPTEHEIDPTVFCHVLATELSKVLRGEKSEVFSKDHWSFFCVECFAVSVHWYSDGRRWYVAVWKLDGHEWHAEPWVFSRN